MVRRTSGFIKQNYATLDIATGRSFLTFEDGTRSYFPERVPKTVKFAIDEDNAADQYAQFYGADVVDAVNSLRLPRYGLGNYVTPSRRASATAAEDRVIHDLSRAGMRLMGSCRTNLFKLLESSGEVFLLSIERHMLPITWSPEMSVRQGYAERRFVPLAIYGLGRLNTILQMVPVLFSPVPSWRDTSR